MSNGLRRGPVAAGFVLLTLCVEAGVFVACGDNSETTTGSGGRSTLSGAGGSGASGGDGAGANGSGGGGETVTLTPAERQTAKSQSPLPAVPPDPTNAYADDPAAAELGQKFYWDKNIAGPIVYTPNDFGAAGDTAKVSCADCHMPAWGSDTRPNNALSLGVNWSTRNTGPIVNIAFYEWFYWDGRSDSLWQQAVLAAENAGQQGSDRLRIGRVIWSLYKDDYEAVFGDEFGPLDARFDPADTTWPATGKPGVVAYDGLDAADKDIITRVLVNWGKAIAAYERLLVSRNAPWDRFVAGDDDAISQDAIRGYKLFVGKAYCINCHSGPFFSDNKMHSIKVPNMGGITDNGLYDKLVTARKNVFLGNGVWSDDTAFGQAKLDSRPEFTVPVPPDPDVAPEETKGLFRTKHMRQITETGPWFHNGWASSLEEIMLLYNAGGGDNDAGVLDPAFTGHQPITEEEMAQVVEFMKTLTGEPPDAALLEDTSVPPP
jgi:cytochrome c peroxidase